jgi:hypothetical protein
MGVEDDPYLDLELMILMECHEDAFGLGRIEDCQWNLAQDDLSDVYAVVKRLADRGDIEIVEREEAGSGRRNAHGVATAAGRRRMAELIDAGIEPAPGVD